MRWRTSISIALCALIAIIALVWWPVIGHFWVRAPSIATQAIADHRATPSDAVLETIAEQSLLSDNPIRGARTVPLAERVLAGSLEYPLMDQVAIAPTFAPADLAAGNETIQTLVASLVAVDWLLRAYEVTRREDFFIAARDYLVTYIDYERSQWMPAGEIWNGFAIAARASILARFWRHYRQRADYDTGVARKVMIHATRIAELLAKPRLFIAISNHGVMHNVGLLQIATTFPALPRADAYRRIAMERLHEQYRFYQSAEGVVLEHSPGYHFTGILLTGFVHELALLSPQGAPIEWQTKLANALRFFRTIRRPDGTLPMIGNTLSLPWNLPDTLERLDTTAPRAGFAAAPSSALYPISGYAVWWDSVRLREGSDPTLVQTMVPWSNFPGHAHKHPDEMSLVLWAAGTTWLTNVGYWPSHAPHHSQATSWSGSSAPHPAGERATSLRETTLRAHLDAPDLRVLDLERAIANGPTVRRQVVQWSARRWIVLDTQRDTGDQPMRTTWTTYPGTEVVQAAATYRMRRADASVSLTLSALTSDGGAIELLRGSTSPFGGWAVVDRRPAATYAARITTARPGGWILTVIELDDSARIAPSEQAIRAANVQTPEQWRIELQRDGETLVVARNGSSVSVSPHAGGATASFALTPGPDVSASRAAIGQAFAELRAKYPRFRDRIDYRWRATIIAIVGSIGLAGLLVLPIARQRRAVPFVLTGLFVLGGLWLAFGYLA